MIVRLAWDLCQWCGLVLRPRESLEAEILFLRRQLALYRERGAKPRRVDAATRGNRDPGDHPFRESSVS
jgi:putative transposase